MHIKMMCNTSKNNGCGTGYAFCFIPLSLYAYGWFDESIKYDTVDIYIGNERIGIAENKVERYNILLHYTNDTGGIRGWRFCAKLNELNGSVKYIKAIARNNGIQQAVLCIKIRGISIQESVLELDACAGSKNNILVIPGASNKVPMLNRIAQKMNNYNFIALIEAVPEDKVVSKMELMKSLWDQYGIDNLQSNLQLYCMPLLFTRNKFLAKWEALLEDEQIRILNENKYLYGLADAIKEKFPNMEISYARFYICEFYKYITNIVKNLNIKGLLLWNQFFVLHDIAKKICDKLDVPVTYVESEVLPGTLAFETLGQMGESEPAVYYNKFKGLTVSQEEIRRAERIIKYLYTSKLNRWTPYGIYRKEQLDRVRNEIMPERPIIFFAGQNDYESGIKPYTENTKRFHSPVFQSSYEAAVFLAELCEKNNWNYIYKRHPMMRREKRKEKLPDNVINFDELEIHDIIDYSDVTVTILSQTAYVALIRNKPVVMLGYNQLRGKGCAYEAFSAEEVEKQIADAVKYGRTHNQVEAFSVHTAQLLKYYLFRDFGLDGEECYGRDENVLIEYLENVFRSGKRYCLLNND